MITCREFVSFLMQYLDGELPAEQREEFEAHLAGCYACVAYMKTYREAIRLGKEAWADDDAVPESTPEDLIQAILHARKT